LSKSKKIIAASAFLALFALAAVFLFSPSQTPVIKPSQVYTWDCEYSEQRPEAITLTCADGGMYVDQIDWSRWSSAGAWGTGVYNVNDCDPNCVEGSFLHIRVKVHLSKLTAYKSKFFLRSLVIRTFNGENLPHGRANFYEWDVMEFSETIGGIQ
jgi:hypothetical protein